MKSTDVQILCGCDAATRCPQGRTGADRQCAVVVPEDILFEIVMALPGFERRFEVSEQEKGIGWAVKQMWMGGAVSRKGWNGPDQWLALQKPDENSKMKKPYIYISPVDGELVPWLASQTDILATDWYLVEHVA